MVDINDPSKEVPIGEKGELLVRGPQVMKGYYNNEQETKNAFFDGWLKTGDVVIMDEEGYITIVDRKKEIIKYKGYTVYPREIEDKLHEHPAVLEAAVIGVPDPVAGENIKAFVVLKKEHVGKTTARDILSWAKKNLATYKYPRFIEVIDKIPKSAAGKILRRKLKEIS